MTLRVCVSPSKCRVGQNLINCDGTSCAKSAQLYSAAEVRLYSPSAVGLVGALARPAAISENLFDLVISLFAKVDFAIEVWNLLVLSRCTEPFSQYLPTRVVQTCGRHLKNSVIGYVA